MKLEIGKKERKKKKKQGEMKEATAVAFQIDVCIWH